MTKSVRRAELVLIALLLVAILLPQLLGGADQGSPNATAPDIASLDDLEHLTACVVTGSSYDVVIRNRFPQASINYVNDWSDECIQVDQGKADFLLWEASAMPELREEYPALTALPDPVSHFSSSWCAPKTPEGKRLVDQINAFLAELRVDDQLQAIYRKWEDQSTAPDHVDPFPSSGAQGPLKIVTCLDWTPMCYQNGDNPCGYLIELLHRFCAWAGYMPVFEYVDVQAALSGFSAGKYDLLGYGMEYQQEASETMYFTDPLMTEPVYAVVRKDRYQGAENAESATDQPATGFAGFWDRLVRSIEKNFIREDRWRMLLSGLGVTMLLSLFSVLFGTALGSVICFMRHSRRPYPNAFARMYIKLLQGTPIVVLLLVLYYIVFGRSDAPAFWVCVLGFSLDFSAYASEIFRSGVEAVPEGQLRAARALGFRPSAAFLHVVFPQMVIHCLPVYIGQLVSTVKLTSVAGYISVVDLTKASDLIRARTYEAFFPLIFTAVIYYLVAALLTLLLKQLEKRLDPMLKKRRVAGVIEHAD